MCTAVKPRERLKHVYGNGTNEKPVIFPTGPPGSEAVPRRPGTPAVLLLRTADGWFQNLEKARMDTTVAPGNRRTSEVPAGIVFIPDPFLPLSIKE